MDAQYFKAPYLGQSDMWKQADALRQPLMPESTIPVPALESLNEDVEIDRSGGYVQWDASGETALSFFANHISRQFGISAEVIVRRLRIERLWPPN